MKKKCQKLKKNTLFFELSSKDKMHIIVYKLTCHFKVNFVG